MNTGINDFFTSLDNQVKILRKILAFLSTRLSNSKIKPIS